MLLHCFKKISSSFLRKGLPSTFFITYGHMFAFKFLRRGFSTGPSSPKAAFVSKSIPKKLPIAGVDNVILVSSAKGGVGKSTVAVNLAIAMTKIKVTNRIGLMDADVFGPSIPHMMGIDGLDPEINAKKLMLPIQNYGIKCMSMGSLIKKDSAVVWRGLMVMSAIQQLLRQVFWGPLDTLIVDTPPGTGDVQLSLSQNIPIQGVVVVTTSHSLSLDDTRRGIEMMLKLKIPLLGVVENMSYFVCPCCQTKSDLWSNDQLDDTTLISSGAAKLAADYNLPLLCRIPIEPAVSVSNDRGQPIVLSHPDSKTTSIFLELAKRVQQFVDK